MLKTTMTGKASTSSLDFAEESYLNGTSSSASDYLTTEFYSETPSTLLDEVSNLNPFIPGKEFSPVKNISLI
jgi:hypothetical protein